MDTRNGLPAKRFASAKAWAAWLDRNHERLAGLWLQFARKDSDIATVSHAEALETALCYGWIDGLTAASDPGLWLQRFTPRRPRSKWSRINCAAADRLLAAGRLKPAGLREMDAAKRDGRWEAAYASQRTMGVPDDLRAGLDAEPRARRFFDKLDSKNRYAILYRIQDAKRPETRQRRIEKFVQMLAEERTIH
jgi:uncharacterized protein YdeI (YjbR/CyaY-like superfamily)